MFKCWNISVSDTWRVSRLSRTFIVDHLLAGPFTPIRQLVIRRCVILVQGLISSTNPLVSTLANWAVNTVQSVTGLNVVNIWQEFGQNPLISIPASFSVKKNERLDENDEEIIRELDILIDNICVQ